LVILKRETIENANMDHISDIGGFDDSERSSEILSELGRVLHTAAKAIKACSTDIERVLVASLSTGHGSKHLHFHLIPKRYDEPVKTVYDPELDGGGMFFLARKEITADTFREFLKSRSGCMTDKLLSDIDKAVAERVAMNTACLKEKFRW
jgi:diadenosine tetraphosphate (Ap4A) HIT family hydrolase